jgi:hypothetical protein
MTYKKVLRVRMRREEEAQRAMSGQGGTPGVRVERGRLRLS